MYQVNCSLESVRAARPSFIYTALTRYEHKTSTLPFTVDACSIIRDHLITSHCRVELKDDTSNGPFQECQTRRDQPCSRKLCMYQHRLLLSNACQYLHKHTIARNCNAHLQNVEWHGTQSITYFVKCRLARTDHKSCSKAAIWD